jgi:hypothetical protein
MANQKLCGWTLMLLGVVLLVGFGNLRLLAALVTLSLMLGYGALRMGSCKTKLSHDLKKG